ncbi:hypothetical protein ACFRQM_48015 [Streptomyces sp. NPDC056831]|uniref:hypothetical protein n=1 Tax=Streptomyces sp. NPDC056831 TaxID=3345954 RepID=UPI00369B9717
MKKQRHIRPAVLVFCVVAVMACAASIIRPWAVGERTRMWVDVIVFPFVVLITFSVILGDRAPDSSTDFWSEV